MFNKPTDIKYSPEIEQKMRSLNVKPILQWVDISNMTEEEKTNNPTSKTTSGFLRSTGRHNFNELTNDDKKFILELPGYDDVIFKQITGVSLLTPKTVKISHNGTEYEINIEKAKELGIIKE